MRAVAFVVLLLLPLVSISHAWKCSEAPSLYKAQKIDAALGQVVAVNINKYAYFLNGNNWYNYQLLRNVKHITTGFTGTWATDNKNILYKLVGGIFTKVGGTSLNQVDAGGRGFLVGILNNRAYCMRSSSAERYKGVGNVHWTALPGFKLKYFSCGLYGCWGVDTSGRVYHAQSINPVNCASSGWRHISSGMSMVEASSDGQVFGVTTTGLVYQRTGISSGRTYGLSWSKIPMCTSMKHVSYDLGRLWVVSTSGLVMTCKH